MKNKVHFMVILLLMSIATVSSASEYRRIALKSIHTVMIISKVCYNMSLSTKVGYYNLAGNKCVYSNETTPHGFDTCGPFYLNGGVLEELVGQGYTCAATHAYSNITGKDGLDEFKLVSDQDGHYVDTDPVSGQINLSYFP